MNGRCLEGDNLFMALSGPYLEAIDHRNDPNRWANYDKALNQYREHQESCSICKIKKVVEPEPAPEVW